MDSVLDKIWEYLCTAMAAAVCDNFQNILDNALFHIGDIASDVGKTPSEWHSSIFAMIKGLSETVALPIAGVILTYVVCYELIQMVISHNNMNQVDGGMIFKWLFKTCVAVFILTNAFDIVMAVFDLAQYVVNAGTAEINSSAGSITAINRDEFINELKQYNAGEIVMIWLESNILRLGTGIMSIFVFFIIYGRMLQIYMMVSLAPIPFATLSNRDWGQIGQNYVKSVLALAFQGFLIVMCLGIYAALLAHFGSMNNVGDAWLSWGAFKAFSPVRGAVWGTVGYTVLLCFALTKTHGLSQSIFNAH